MTPSPSHGTLGDACRIARANIVDRIDALEREMGLGSTPVIEPTHADVRKLAYLELALYELEALIANFGHLPTS